MSDDVTITPALPPGAEPQGPEPHRPPPPAARAAERLRALANEAEEAERRVEAERRARDEEWRRRHRECARIAAEAGEEYNEVVRAVFAALPGFGALARRLEDVEGRAMQRGAEVYEAGGAEVRDHLRSHRAEALRPFLNLLRDDYRAAQR